MKEHSRLILEYLRDQLQILRQTISNIDARIRNYLIITGLIWGVVLQSSRYCFTLLLNSKNMIYNWALFFLFALLNIVLITSLLRILSIFSRVKFSIPHFVDKNTILKNVIHKDNISDDVVTDFIVNYHKAVKENIERAKKRNLVFIAIRKLLYLGIGLFVIYSFALGISLFNGKNIVLFKTEGRALMFDDEKEEKPVQDPDEEIRPSMQGDPEVIKLGESEKDSKAKKD